MIDEKELIEAIKLHKKNVCCGDSKIDIGYGMAHDHIIDLINILAT